MPRHSPCKAMDSKNQKDRIINSVIFGLQRITLVVAAVLVYLLDFLTVPYLAAIYCALAALFALTFVLQYKVKDKRMWMARTFSLVITVVLVIGEVYLQKTFSAIADITEPEQQTAKVAVYVLKDSPAKDASDLEDCDFGIMEKMDRDNTDAALDELEEELGEQILTYEYASPTELAAALLQGKVDAIVLNEAYINVVEDTAEAILEAGDAGGDSDADKEQDKGDGAGRENEDADADEGSINDGDASSNDKNDTKIDDETMSLLTDFGSMIREVVSYEIPQESLGKHSGKKDRDDHTLVCYVSGIDTRGSIKNVSRSDVNILVVANTETKQIVMINTPRDYFVPLSISDGVRDKLTHAGLYGVDCSMETLEMLYGVDIDYYFRVNFSGFEKIIDALGGIDVVSDYSFTHEGYSFKKGTNHMSGAAALHFARDRFSFGNGDVQRGEHQMRVIEAVFEKVTSPSMLAKYTSLMDSLDSAFDTNMDYDTVSELVRMQLEDNAEWNFVMYHVDGTGKRSTTYSVPDQKAYVLVPDEEMVETAKDLMKQVRHGKTVEPIVQEDD